MFVYAYVCNWIHTQLIIKCCVCRPRASDASHFEVVGQSMHSVLEQRHVCVAFFFNYQILKILKYERSIDKTIDKYDSKAHADTKKESPTIENILVQSSTVSKPGWHNRFPLTSHIRCTFLCAMATTLKRWSSKKKNVSFEIIVILM